jgi:excisionase family DNA binding protein
MMSNATKNLSVQSAVLNVEEASDYLRISRASVWRMLKNGNIARVRLGGRTVIRRVDLDALLERSVEVQ